VVNESRDLLAIAGDQSAAAQFVGLFHGKASKGKIILLSLVFGYCCKIHD
jgi:hypothetical protein